MTGRAARGASAPGVKPGAVRVVRAFARLRGLVPQTPGAQALTLVAKKLKASLAIEGELGDEGLATFGDDGEDLLMALARSLTDRVEANDDSLEGLFAEFRGSGQTQDAALLEDARMSSQVVVPPWPATSAHKADDAPSQDCPSVLLSPGEVVRFKEVDPSGQQLRLF